MASWVLVASVALSLLLAANGYALQPIDKAELAKYNHVYASINNNTAQVSQLEKFARNTFKGIVDILEELEKSEKLDAEQKNDLREVLAESKGSVETIIELLFGSIKDSSTACDTTVGYDLREAKAESPFPSGSDEAHGSLDPSPEEALGSPASTFYLSQFFHNGAPCVYNIPVDGAETQKIPAYMIYSGINIQAPDSSGLIDLLPTTRNFKPSYRTSGPRLYGDIQKLRDAIRFLPRAILRQSSSSEGGDLGPIFTGGKVNTTCGSQNLGDGVDYIAPMQVLASLSSSLVAKPIQSTPGNIVLSLFGDKLYDLDLDLDEISADPSKFPQGRDLRICLYQDDNDGFDSTVSEMTDAVNRAFIMARLAMGLPLPSTEGDGGSTAGESTTTTSTTPTSTAPTANVTTTSTASTSNSGSGNACFPGDAIVELEDGSVVAMEDISIGDSVKVGTNQFSKVFMFTHKLANIEYEFVTIVTKSGNSLTLTRDHYLYSDNVLVPASEVRVGAKLALGNGESDYVTLISPSRSRGLYNPQTIHGDIVVNGVVSSTYTAAIHPTLAHAFLGPFRFLHSVGIHFTALESGSLL